MATLPDYEVSENGKYVYVLTDGVFSKIGTIRVKQPEDEWTYNPPDTRMRERVQELQTGSARRLKVAAIYPDSDGCLERDLHEHLDLARISGEWFAVSVETIQQAYEQLEGVV